MVSPGMKKSGKDEKEETVGIFFLGKLYKPVEELELLRFWQFLSKNGSWTLEQ